MNVRMSASLILFAAFASGCDKIPFLGGGADTTASDTAAVDAVPAAMPDSSSPESTPAPATDQSAGVSEPVTPSAQPVDPEPPSQSVREQVQTVARANEVPWTPERTGTVQPGMTAEQVQGEWGTPAVQRTNGNWTFMYYRNGCERSCGTFDVVFLQDGQVVDAIVRGMGHDYAGVSSSPADRPASFTPPAGNQSPDTLRVVG